MAKQKIDLIRQALSAAESSIKLSRQLLSDLERETDKYPKKDQGKSLPGMVGIFDGKDMIAETGEKIEIPENYASKSILVVGDTLKLVGEGNDKKFKQIEHVKRHKTNGIITKKEGKWAVVTPEGSYKVLAASVDHFGGDVGDEALVQIPAKNLQVPWAAVEKVTKKNGESKVKAEDQPKEEAEKKTPPKEDMIANDKTKKSPVSKSKDKNQPSQREKTSESTEESKKPRESIETKPVKDSSDSQVGEQVEKKKPEQKEELPVAQVTEVKPSPSQKGQTDEEELS